jgi:hypothetical protein
MTGSVIFDPLLPIWLIAVLAALVASGLALALWRGLAGWPFRALAGLVILAALMGPAYQQEERTALSDIVLIVEDQSASQDLTDRATRTAEAADTLTARLEARGNTEVRRVQVPDAPENGGTQAMTALHRRWPKSRWAVLRASFFCRMGGSMMSSGHQTFPPRCICCTQAARGIGTGVCGSTTPRPLPFWAKRCK